MQKITGRYNSATIFASTVEETALEQIHLLCDQEFCRDSRIRIMPDVHAGKGCTIGTTMTITDRVVPNLVGVDIGCGMETVRLASGHLDFKRLDELIHRNIPSGFKIREKPHRLNDEIDLNSLRASAELKLDRARKSIGTLGGGNHFIEVDRKTRDDIRADPRDDTRDDISDDAGALYLVIHSGSRHLGQEIAGYYQEEAWRQCNRNSRPDLEELIETLKQQGRHREIAGALKAAKARDSSPIPRDLAYLTGSLLEDYLHDMKIVQHFATLNRKAMAEEILTGLGLEAESSFTTIHNYIDTEMMILRKGAVSAKAGEKLLIPINMRDGSLICRGKGNEDWNYSAPHGAGRLMSRSQARKRFALKDFKREMKGVFTTTVGKGTLDECPMAYKSMKDIVGNLDPTAEILSVLRPVYNFKAGE